MRDQVRKEMIALLPRLRRFAHALTGNGNDGDDLAQATCARAITHIGRWQDGTRLDSWMFRIAQNLHRNNLRAARVRASHLRLVGEYPAAIDDGPAAMETRITLQAVRDFVGHLPEEQRSVLICVCVEGLSYKETAAILDLPVGTVTSRLARARLALRAHLRDTNTEIPATEVELAR